MHIAIKHSKGNRQFLSYQLKNHQLRSSLSGSRSEHLARCWSPQRRPLRQVGAGSGCSHAEACPTGVGPLDPRDQRSQWRGLGERERTLATGSSQHPPFLFNTFQGQKARNESLVGEIVTNIPFALCHWGTLSLWITMQSRKALIEFHQNWKKAEQTGFWG